MGFLRSDGSVICPGCDGDDFSVIDHALTDGPVADRVSPHARVCRGCGYLMLFAGPAAAFGRDDEDALDDLDALSVIAATARFDAQ